MFAKTYRNKAGKSFTEGRKFRMAEFCAYYNTLTDEEWDEAIEMAADKGYDISNIKPYIRVYGDRPHFEPMCFEEVREKLLQLHDSDNCISELPACIISFEAERSEIESLYASLGVPVPEYWTAKLWC